MAAQRKPDPRRTAELAAIHVGRRALGWDEETYRGALEQLVGKRSSAKLSAGERAIVLDRMRELGYARTDGSTAPRPRATQAAKLRALWAELAATGELREPTEAALRAWVERMTGKSRLEWCTPAELRGAIEALKRWLDRTADSHGGS